MYSKKINFNLNLGWRAKFTALTGRMLCMPAINKSFWRHTRQQVSNLGNKAFSFVILLFYYKGKIFNHLLCFLILSDAEF